MAASFKLWSGRTRRQASFIFLIKKYIRHWRTHQESNYGGSWSLSMSKMETIQAIKNSSYAA